MDGKDHEASFELFDLYRRSKKGVYSIVFKRGESSISIEYDLKNHPRIDFSKKTHLLLYGKKEDSMKVWKSLQLNESIKYVNVDIRQDFPTVSKDIPKN